MCELGRSMRGKGGNEMCSSNIVDSIAKELGSIDGLSGSGWARTPGGGVLPGCNLHISLIATLFLSGLGVNPNWGRNSEVCPDLQPNFDQA
eukprot:908398-Pelagomonas_calceolata.AAC.8